MSAEEMQSRIDERWRLERNVIQAVRRWMRAVDSGVIAAEAAEAIALQNAIRELDATG